MSIYNKNKKYIEIILDESIKITRLDNCNLKLTHEEYIDIKKAYEKYKSRKNK